MLLDFVVWNASPELFSIGPFTVRWYGLMFGLGFLIGYAILGRIFRHEGAPERWLGTLLLWVVGATIIGARLGHVLFYEWSYYRKHPLEILMVWEGGLASHGGTIAIILAVILFSIFTTKRNPIWTFDRLVIPVALVAGMIRIGNLMNSEIFGHATNLPWGFMYLRSREWHLMYEGQACHPTQLYEAGCYFALFALLMWMYWRKNAEERPGLLFGMFLIGTFLSRFFIEFIKNDQVAFEASMTLNMGQWLSIPFVIAGIALVAYAMSRPKVKLSFPNHFADENSASRKR